MMKSTGYYQNSRREMCEFIPNRYSRVLDIGCAEGRFATNLNPSAEIWGVEMNARSADIAKTRMKKVLVGSYMSVADQLPNDYFDLVICNDVIEHMQYHTMFLETIKKKIVNGGCIIGSVPNIRYIYNLYNLLVKRDWKYGEIGVLDSTHLRFFTERSIKREMLEKDYIIEVFKGINPFGYSTNMFKRITKKILWGGLFLFTFGTFKDTRYCQFGFRIKPKKQPEKLQC